MPFEVPFAQSTDPVDFEMTVLRKLKAIEFLYLMIFGSKWNLLFPAD